MGRWGWRRIATLWVSVWVMAACGRVLPAPSVSSPSPTQAPLILRTAPPASDEAPSVTAEAATVTATEPPPSRTPDPSSTPHYYTIVSGDTLEHIAARFGVSIAALREINGGLPPDMVIPGQVLLIPPTMSGSPTGTFTRVLPTRTPLPIALAAPDCYPTPADELLCLGWLPNPLSATVQDVAVRVILRGGGGEARAERSTASVQAIIPPGEGAPYAVRFSAPPSFDYVEVVLLSVEEASPVAGGPVPLTWRDGGSQPGRSVTYVSGAVRHNGQTPLTDLLVVITLLDADGRVTGFRVLRPAGTLAPGEELIVDAPVMALGSGMVRHHVYAEGWPVE